MINLTTFFTSLGIVNGNTEATNFYEFWYGIEFSDGTITYNITEFMTYLGTNRYEFFHSLESTYPGVYDEYTFYSNIDDPRIYDFKTFYEYAGEYLGGSPPPVVSYDWAISDGNNIDGCAASSAYTVYTTGRTLSTGDIIYSDSNLTTPFVGLGIGNYYDVWYKPEPGNSFCNGFISASGEITLQGMCGVVQYISGAAESGADACSYAVGDYEVRVSATIGTYIWQDLYYSYYPPISLSLITNYNPDWVQVVNEFKSIRISNGGEVIEIYNC